MTEAFCHRRRDDGSAWLFVAGEVDSEIWQDCTSEQHRAATSSCLYGACDSPPNSTCGAASTCDVLSCGGVVYDQQGCRRAHCVTQADCSGGTRCVQLECGDSTYCNFTLDTCSCLSLDGCGPDARCAPEELVGPAGAWRTLTIVSIGSECPTLCMETVSMNADGSGTYESTEEGIGPESFLLETEQLESLSLVVDGPELRAVLNGQQACPLAPQDATTRMTLELEDRTLEATVSGCASGDGASLDFRRLKDLTRAIRSR